MEPDDVVMFTLEGEALDELERAALLEGRDRHMQAKMMLLKSLNKYQEYVPEKKASGGTTPPRKRPSRTSRPTAFVPNAS